jgi:hypothetical protein
MTSLDCPPSDGTYIATLPSNLTPLTTGEALSTAADGNVCPDQVTPGAFGSPDVRAIRQQGSLNIATMEATLVSNFCIQLAALRRPPKAVLDHIGDGSDVVVGLGHLA